MEAYHPHKKKHHKKKLKLKDYLSEFVMIFIAILGGFLMENLREQYVDHHKEKEYIVRLIRDLKEDTTRIREVHQINSYQIQGLDSLAQQFNQPISAVDAEVFVNRIVRYMNNYTDFIPKEITISQMRNTGGLRLIRKSAVADSITDYYSTIEYRRELNVKSNFKYLDEALKLELQFIDFSTDMKNFNLNRHEVGTYKELKNRCLFFKAQLAWDNVWIEQSYRQSASLIKFLKKEYRIRD